MLTIMAAAALVLPNAEADFARMVEDDVPHKVLKTDVAGIWYQAFVDNNGKIIKCSVRGMLGESDEGQLACDTVIGRQITPARADGKPAYGVYRGVMVLADSQFDADAIQFEPDVLLEVENLPTTRPMKIDLVVMVGPDGLISACKSKNGRFPAYAEVACEQAKDIKMPIGKSEAGEAVAYVYPLTYEFTESLASR